MKLDYLRPLYATTAPYASVYLDMGHAAEEPAKALDLRWRHTAAELTRMGADDPTIGAIEAVVTRPGRTEAGLAVFAAEGRVVHSEGLPEPPPPSARFGALPDVMPLIERRREPVPHVRVKADRKGADIVTIGRRRRRTTVTGEEWPIRKVRAGGWSEQRYQRSAVETWEHNAREVASRVAREAAAVDAALIMVGGDVRARELVLESLAEPYVRRAVPTEHGVRAAGASESAWEDEVAQLIDEHRAQRRDAVVARFRAGEGRGDSVTGFAGVTAALGAGQVEALPVRPPVGGELWYGPEAHQLAADEDGLRELGVKEPRTGPAGSVLARAAVCTDAEIVVTDRIDPPDRVGALLRFRV